MWSFNTTEAVLFFGLVLGLAAAGTWVSVG
jgi:hypothetical protein